MRFCVGDICINTHLEEAVFEKKNSQRGILQRNFPFRLWVSVSVTHYHKTLLYPLFSCF